MDTGRFDCLIIGGGAAGLTAAVYMGRYKRRVLVLDDDGSRLNWIPRTRNVPGFPDGIEGPELLSRMRAHAAKYAIPTERTRVERLLCLEDGSFQAESAQGRWRARFVILATGARDVEPEIEGIPAALQAGQVRYCPICDGYETQGQRVAVLGRGRHGLRESLFIANWAREVTWLAMATQEEVDPRELARLRDAHVRIAASPPQRIECGVAGAGVRVDLQDGQVLEFDTIYPALGLHHACELATALGARARENGQLEVDAHQQTTVPGLYVAGDVAVDLNQISVATGHAAIAATAIHNRL
ncbi:NAD(P)/FAD-dependent oxidoreductase [Ramlibacter pallidus]|uniref:NAD(P)/FAD-dependent oxidoreductase n=1 Tax=Ramlibacter pallidus TaxID=2780087 RepID=A0ABR9S9A8_9BURK|nr:NAD(P)/FAD-dependent oxidoreductase [Ramlibacter pallidus]MBE7370091.1 NAD(P)/FAD-dependent oxidoreductase [Ramlibacter pallidus]